MTPRMFSLTGSIIFAIISILQLARAFFGWPVTIDGYDVPLWVSWITFIVASGLSHVGWKAYASDTYS